MTGYNGFDLLVLVISLAAVIAMAVFSIRAGR